MNPRGRGVLGVRRVRHHAGREAAVGVVVVVQRQAELLEVVLALGPVGRLADLLDGGQEQADQDRDDRDDDEQLDERERGPASHEMTLLSKMRASR